MSEKNNTVNHNGLILKTNYIPEELLILILSYVDYKELVLCHLVCKQWEELIKKSVWRKKAERDCGQALFFDDKTPWKSYYSICHKKPFERNLLTSKNVQVFYDNQDEFETIQVNIKDSNTPISILPFPEDAFFKENISCINIVHDSIVSVKRKFLIDLIKEGCTDYILDNLQPDIEICEWYSSDHKEEKAEYECSIKLLNGSDTEEDCGNRVMRVYHFDKKLNNSNKRGKWFKFTHLFKNYGPGLRVIKFQDGGHNNIIMTGASVMLKMPSRKSTST